MFPALAAHSVRRTVVALLLDAMGPLLSLYIPRRGPEFPFLVLDLLPIILSYPKARLGFGSAPVATRSKIGKGQNSRQPAAFG